MIRPFKWRTQWQHSSRWERPRLNQIRLSYVTGEHFSLCRTSAGIYFHGLLKQNLVKNVNSGDREKR